MHDEALPPMSETAQYGVLETDHFCDCGYNLHGQRVEQDERLGFTVVRCTECGRWHPAGHGSSSTRVWLRRLATLLLTLWIFVLLGVGFALTATTMGLSFGFYNEYTTEGMYDSNTGRQVHQQSEYIRNDDGSGYRRFTYTFADTGEPVPPPTDSTLVDAEDNQRYYDERQIPTWKAQRPSDADDANSSSKAYDPYTYYPYRYPTWRTGAAIGGFTALGAFVFGVIQAGIMWHLRWPAKLIPVLLVSSAAFGWFVFMATAGNWQEPVWEVIWVAAAVVIGGFFVGWTLGLVVGRPIMRGVTRLIIPSKPRQAFAHLWHVDGKKLAVGFVALLAVTGCSSAPPKPMLAALYQDEARSDVHRLRPVVVIPGILGTRLIEPETQTVVWGAFSGDFANPGRESGARLVAMPMEEGVELSELSDNVAIDGALDEVELKIFGLPIRLSAYADIMRILGVVGYRDADIHDDNLIDYGDEHFTCFQFDYDWRRDNAESAALLYRELQSYRLYVFDRIVEEEGEETGLTINDIKFDIVAHSMGGLVARYMLRYGDAPLPADGSLPELTWKGAEMVDRLIMVGTPNAGSVDSFRQLVDGKDFNDGSPAFWLPKVPAAVLGSMPSIYQLLPRDRHHGIIDAKNRTIPLYDPQYWIDNEIGLADPKQDKTLGWIIGDDVAVARRREIAVDHLRKSLFKAEQFHRALDVRAARPEGLNIHIFAGDAVETASRLRLQPDGRERVETVSRAAGDGTVLRSSALMDERLALLPSQRPMLPVQSPIDFTGVMFLFQDHIGITRSPEFTDNVLFLLLESP